MPVSHCWGQCRSDAALSLRPVPLSCSAVHCLKNTVDAVVAGGMLVTAGSYHL